MMATQSPNARAIVAHEPKDDKPNLAMENVVPRELNADELLVRMVATGVCHTDLVFSVYPEAFGGPFPRVLGHEGSGYVEKVGSEITGFKPGDSVLMSFVSCSKCYHCLDKHPAYCDKFSPMNYTGETNVFDRESGGKTSGVFFGQSSFSNLSIVKKSSVVNVSHLIKSDEELKLFAPLGCGIQTGAGTVDNLAGAGPKDAVVILGLGGVGLAGIMAAKIKGCKTIIGVDLFAERLKLAEELGATHSINTSLKDVNLIGEVKRLTDGNGASIVVDTTGVMKLIEAAQDFTASRGQFIFLGIAPADGSLNTHIITFMQTGKILRGSIEGDVTPSVYIPNMIQWYRDGKFPIDRLIRYYPADDFQTALADMKTGAAIKPVLVW